METEIYDDRLTDVDKNKGESQIIKAINRDTVHRICSGQVVLSLAVAMKELVENSIDAGASRIDIHTKEHGSQLLEISDNGSGVREENFEALTLKHYTSKITQFSDLEQLGTLGFRGEALSSLCALSELVIVSKHFSAPYATKITFDCNGKITSKVTAAREQGTTVTLKKLFSTLPVRRKEFTKNLKREFNKMCQLLYAYCLVCKGVKFTCTNVTDKGSRNTVVATEGKNSVRENIVNVFGAKQISSLIDIYPTFPDESIQNQYGLLLAQNEELPFTFEFFISSSVHGSGRSSTDRQFYYINSRPCEPTKLMKLVNEVYKQFNSHQYPFVFLNVTAKSCLVDVNVTPDKRQIFIENDKLLLSVVHASLLEAFKVFPSTYKMQNTDISSLFLSKAKGKDVGDRGIKRSFSDNIPRKGSILETFKKRSRTEGTTSSENIDLDIFINKPKIKSSSFIENDYSIGIEKEVEEDFDKLVSIACKLTSDDTEENIVDIKDASDNADLEIGLDQPVVETRKKKSIPLRISFENIKKVLENKDSGTVDETRVRFRSKITPESNKNAEDELQKQISKKDFFSMEIIGQFNAGFIVAKLNNDLFLIDQHASDEKYNFEQLQATTVLKSQDLVRPKALELSAGHESLLIENLEVFQKNGFSFAIDETAPCTKKVALTSMPMNRNCILGQEDIEEMLYYLQNSSQTTCRPRKVRQMFASRACRKSVMIGKELSKSEMTTLVHHMGEIDQPWNCPHGRPTMRHLCNLHLIQDGN